MEYDSVDEGAEEAPFQNADAPLDEDAADADGVVREIEQPGGAARAFGQDFALDAAGRRLADAVTAWSPVDILVLNASIELPEAYQTITRDPSYEVHSAYGCRCAPGMKLRPSLSGAQRVRLPARTVERQQVAVRHARARVLQRDDRLLALAVVRHALEPHVRRDVLVVVQVGVGRGLRAARPDALLPRIASRLRLEVAAAAVERAQQPARLHRPRAREDGATVADVPNLGRPRAARLVVRCALSRCCG